MPMNEEVRKAMESMDLRFTSGNSIAIERASMRDHEWLAIRAELHRLYAIADSVEPLVVRLGEVTTKLEAANALLREAIEWNWLDEGAPRPDVMDVLDQKIQAHLSEPRT